MFNPENKAANREIRDVAQEERAYERAMETVDRYGQLKTTLRRWCGPSQDKASAGPLSFDQVVTIIANDPDVREPVKEYLAGRWSLTDGVTTDFIRERLAWAVVEALEKELQDARRHRR